ncbi:hypothetical protein FKM82_013684 [Ascaphus truei]
MANKDILLSRHYFPAVCAGDNYKRPRYTEQRRFHSVPHPVNRSSVLHLLRDPGHSAGESPGAHRLCAFHSAGDDSLHCKLQCRFKRG